MDCRMLTADLFDLSAYRFAAPQRSGALTIVPILGQPSPSPFLSPGEGLQSKWEPSQSVWTLGSESGQAPMLLPLHTGIGVAPRQCVLLSSAALLPPSKRMKLTGEISLFLPSSARQTFDVTENAVLPLPLRGQAWRLRYLQREDRLQPDIRHLEHQFSSHRSFSFSRLLQGSQQAAESFARRFELLTGQTGALFFLDNRPVGLEIAPSPAFFATLWEPLLCGCYGIAALLHEQNLAPMPSPQPYDIEELSQLRTRMFEERHRLDDSLAAVLTTHSQEVYTLEAGQSWHNFRLHSFTSQNYAGQYIEEILPPEPNPPPETAALPRMFRTLFRKNPAPSDTAPRRLHYVSLFAI